MVRLPYAGVVGLVAGVLALLVPDVLLNALLHEVPTVPFPWFAETLIIVVPLLVVPLGLAACCFALADRQGTSRAVEAALVAAVATGVGWVLALVLTSGDLSAPHDSAWYLLASGVAYITRGGVAALAGFGLVAVRER